MKAIQDYLGEKAGEFSRRPFFARLERPAPLAEVMPFPVLLTFWVMVFQDILRLNTSLVTDPVLVPVAQRHLREDLGHNIWFLQDLELIDGQVPDLRGVFGEEHWTTREATYGLMAETFRAEDDIDRIVLIMTLEEAGKVFFSRIVPYFTDAGLGSALRYFAVDHFEIEQSHELHGGEVHEVLDAIELSVAVVSRCRRMIDRCFAQFTRLFDVIDERLAAPLDNGDQRYQQRAQHLLVVAAGLDAGQQAQLA